MSRNFGHVHICSLVAKCTTICGCMSCNLNRAEK